MSCKGNQSHSFLIIIHDYELCVYDIKKLHDFELLIIDR